MKYTKRPSADKNKKMVKPDLPSGFDLFKPSWEAVKLNIWTFITLLLIPTGLEIAYLIASPATSTNRNSISGSSLIILLLIIVINIILSPSLIITQLKSSKGMEIEPVEALKSGFKYIGRLLILDILILLIVVVGLILLIVPGVILFRRYILAPYIMVNENLGIKASLKRSAELTKNGGIWNIIGVYALIGIVGIVPILGQIVSFLAEIAYSCSMPLRYLELKEIAKISKKPKSTNTAIEQ
jgi:hypothetical protein